MYVDVDDTLVRTAGSKRIPIVAAVERVRSLHAKGATLYLWSSGGSEYAKQTATELGISACFAGFLPKPTRIVDDQHITQWLDLIHLHPNQDFDA